MKRSKSEKVTKALDEAYATSCDSRANALVWGFFWVMAILCCFTTLCSCGSVLPKPVMHKSRPMHACSTPIQIIETTDPVINAAVWSAAAAWNARLGWKAFTAKPAACRVVVVRQRLDGPDAIGQTRYHNHNGCSRVLTLRLAPRMSFEDNHQRLPWVIAHELGHVLGLDHSPHKGDLMHKHAPKLPWKQFGHVSDEEVELIEKLQQGSYKGEQE